MDIDIKIYIKNDEGIPILGRGPVLLLEEIENTGSIRKASKNMEMSYSKAHTLIKKIEKNFSFDIVKKSIGGKSGGGTKLTRKGKELIDRYKKIESTLKDKSRKVFKDFRKNTKFKGNIKED